MKIAHVMTSPAVAVAPDTPVQEVVRLLIRHRIGSVPVVDEDGRLLGLVTETDLFPQHCNVPFSTVRAAKLFDEWTSPEMVPALYARSRQMKAAEVMTTRIEFVEADADVTEAIRTMVDHERKHMPVVRNGRLAGIVTRHDLLRALC